MAVRIWRVFAWAHSEGLSNPGIAAAIASSMDSAGK